MKCEFTNSCLEKRLLNTTWVVPPETLEAYVYTDENKKRVTDQTVWTISGYSNGYFFGDSYVALDGVNLLHTKLLGSVTPLGDVLIAFYSETSNTVSGYGKFTGKKFIMQMNTMGSIGVAHWSYMISVKPGDPFYQSLPSLGISVPTFISQFK